jgi:hypothetical protein
VKSSMLPCSATPKKSARSSQKKRSDTPPECLITYVLFNTSPAGRSPLHAAWQHVGAVMKRLARSATEGRPSVAFTLRGQFAIRNGRPKCSMIRSWARAGMPPRCRHCLIVPELIPTQSAAISTSAHVSCSISFCLFILSYTLSFI